MSSQQPQGPKPTSPTGDEQQQQLNPSRSTLPPSKSNNPPPPPTIPGQEGAAAPVVDVPLTRPPDRMTYYDDKGVYRAIRIPKERYLEICRLFKEENWEALGEFEEWKAQTDGGVKTEEK